MAHKPIKILFVHYGDAAVRGSEVCLHNLLSQLDRSQFEPMVWCNSPELASYIKRLNIEVIQSSFNILFGWQQPRFNFLASFRLVKQAKQIIQQYQIELVHCNSGAPCQWMSAACKATNTKLLTHLHAPYPLRDRLTLALHKSDRLVCVNNEINQQFVDDGMASNRVLTIANGVDIKRHQRTFPLPIRQQLGLKKQDLLLATVGFLSHEKGIDNCIKLVATLRDKHQVNAHLMIIGEGPMRKSLTELTEQLALTQQIHFMDSCDLVTSLLKQNADIYICGSRAESFGLALAEAAISHVPVVAPDLGGIPMLIQHLETGLLYEPANQDDFAFQVVRLINNPNLAKQIARQAHQHVINNFSLTQYSQSFTQAYLDLLADKRPASWSLSFAPFTRLIKLSFKSLINRVSRSISSVPVTSK